MCSPVTHPVGCSPYNILFGVAHSQHVSHGITAVHHRFHSKHTASPKLTTSVSHQQVRPPVQHRFGCGPLQPGEQTPGVSVFRHHLLQHFMLSLFCKLPVQPQDTIAGMRAGFMARLMLSILQFRINSRYSTTACPPFISIEMDHSDSAREGCTVSTLTVTAEPKDWKQAIEVRLTCKVHVF